MTFRAIVVTFVLACVGVVLIVIKLGTGGPLYIAMLGASAIWMLPGPFALALPAGAFGGVLLTQAEYGTRVTIDENSTVETVRLAVFATLLSTLTVGWLVPLAYHETGQAVSRFQDAATQIEQPEVSPEELMLDELFVGMRSVPGARQELFRRALWIAPCFLMPLFAGVLVMLIPRWTHRGAAVAILAVFVISVQLAFRSIP